VSRRAKWPHSSPQLSSARAFRDVECVQNVVLVGSSAVLRGNAMCVPNGHAGTRARAHLPQARGVFSKTNPRSSRVPLPKCLGRCQLENFQVEFLRLFFLGVDQREDQAGSFQARQLQAIRRCIGSPRLLDRTSTHNASAEPDFGA
jgi:hypothetical protein